MKITALVENMTNCDLRSVHGLSLLIETQHHKILFDVGPDNTLFQNCEARGVDLSQIDIVILSHGHADHGGAMEKFLRINKTAKIYAQRKAFEKHYAKILFKRFNIGIGEALKSHPQLVLLEGDHVIDGELTLFTVTDIQKCYSSANDTLYSAMGKDDFSHEQSLMITGGENVLVMGCGHAGVVNIMEKAAKHNPRICVGGYHLFNPNTKKTVPDKLLDAIAGELKKYDVRYYTCHCTGRPAFRYLSARLPHMEYLSCGDVLEV